MRGLIDSSAQFSPCRRYRYALLRRWEPDRELLGFVGLNPSTADETADDPTIRRCIGFARDRGFGGVIVCNVYALRSTDPTLLRRHVDPVGPDNAVHLKRLRKVASQVIAAWGVHAPTDEVLSVLECLPDLDCLGVNQGGSPRHPLYVPADAPFVPYSRSGIATRLPQPTSLPPSPRTPPPER